MRTALLALLGLLTVPTTHADTVPQGRLPDEVRPLAYRLNLTILPEQPRFAGHVEIDVELQQPLRSMYLHGRDLRVSAVTARSSAGRRVIKGNYTEVDLLGVARLDLAEPLPTGKATLSFDYDAPFGTSASGLYRTQVAGDWYAWTQFESIDARAAFPGFDQPGYKTPFTVSLTTAPGHVAFSNGAETGSSRSGAHVVHRFATTPPLPTYLVAFAVGPFVTRSGVAPPTPQRKAALPMRVIATQPNKDRLDFAIQNTDRIVALLEQYFDSPFPFSKLDQIGSPIMGGAMENAGAIIYGDTILLLDPQASPRQLSRYGSVVAHEIAHQWFGDLVTPQWWDDIWLNESFASWMGYRIGNEWRPDLSIGLSAKRDAFSAMDLDALQAGRPIHQPIESNGQIDGAFDAVTYGKGGQVIAMIAAYLGDDKFRDGVRLHLRRHAFGNATTNDFFASLADSAKDPRVLAALRSFVDQQGVPVLRVERTAQGVSLQQQRYGVLGSTQAQQRWVVPTCVRLGAARQCSLLDSGAGEIAIKGEGALMPNAGGSGYYRFSLASAEWQRLIAESAQLAPAEALATTDSLWAEFQSGNASARLLIEGAKAMAANPYSQAALDAGERLAGLRQQGVIAAESLPAYRATMRRIYQPLLAQLGFDPRRGAYRDEDPNRQRLRVGVAALLADEAADESVQGTLRAAASAYLDGNTAALDTSLLSLALRAHVRQGGQTAAAQLLERAVTSDDSLFRGAALGALGSSGDAQVGTWLLKQMADSRLRPSDRLDLASGLSAEPATRESALQWLNGNFDSLVKQSGIFSADRLPGLAANQCGAEQARGIETTLRPKVIQYKRGELRLDRTVERVRNCGRLREARGAELAAALQEG